MLSIKVALEDVYELKNTFCSIKPSLKKVSKYENKFAKLQKKAGEFNLRSQLKNVKKKEFTMDQEEPGVSYMLRYSRFEPFLYRVILVVLLLGWVGLG